MGITKICQNPQTKKFLTKEAVIFPVSVQDDKQLDGSHTLFARMSPFPTKKVKSYSKIQIKKRIIMLLSSVK